MHHRMKDLGERKSSGTHPGVEREEDEEGCYIIVIIEDNILHLDQNYINKR